MLIVKQPPFSYMKSSLIFISYFRRLYKGTLPSLVTSSYLLRKFTFNDCHYDKNCVLHIMLTFAMTHIHTGLWLRTGCVTNTQVSFFERTGF